MSPPAMRPNLGNAPRLATATTAPDELVVWLDAPGAGERHLGGKAQSLVRMLAAGLPVPPGFVILPEAFPNRGAGGPPGSEQSPGRANVMSLSPEVVAAVRAAYTELGLRTSGAGQWAVAIGETASSEPLVAVRSSAQAEDLAGASFAGQYETVLGVCGAERVVECALRCWRSLWSERADAYRATTERRTGDPLPAPEMAVLVQALVPATAAGVAFTVDPAAGDCLAISAAWGLGRSVVDGEVEPDTWQLDRQTLAVVNQTTGDKATRVVASTDSPREAVPDPLASRPCLTPEQVHAVARLALAAEHVLGAPADVEWAVEGEKVWVLQARPITTASATSVAATASRGGEPAAPAPPPTDAGRSDAAVEPTGPTPQFPFAWPDPADATLHWTKDAVDVRAPEAMPPLELDVRARFARSMRHSAEITGRRRAPRLIELHGWQYWCYAEEAPDTPTLAHRRQSFQRMGDMLHERGENYLDAVIFPEMRAGNRRLGSVDPDALSNAELATHLQEALDWYERGWTLHWTRPDNDPRARFTALYKEITGDERREAASELLAHETNKMTEAIDGLTALARIVQQHPALRALFAKETPENLLTAVSTVESSDGGDAFRRALDSFLDPERQGLRSGASWGVEQNQCMPGWRDQPEIVLSLVQKYVPLDLAALAAMHAQAVAERDRRTAEVRDSIPDERQRSQFDFWLAAGRRAVQAQENHNYYIDSATNALLHRAISACGRRLAAAGALDDVSDVWWLREHEIDEALRGLQRPEGERPAHWRQLVAAQKALHEWHRSLRPPPALGAPPPQPQERPSVPPAGSTPPEAAPPTLLVQGQPAAAGRRTGRVRLVDYRDVVPDVRPGDVLVAHTAGALWGPLAPALAGVVLERGGPFQHIMIVCREFGIPGIANAKEATTRLTEGQLVVVDAEHGWVLPAE